MNYRTLGRTGLRVSEIGLGTMVHAGHFGPMDDADSIRAIEAALDLGVNFIDTAEAYGAGYSEALLGKALKGKRDRVILTTKGGNVMVGPNRGKTDFSLAFIGRIMDESLQRLQTDHVDLYQLHNPKLDTIQSTDIWELLERRKREGKIRYYGISINTMEEGVASVKCGRPDTIQIEYNLLFQDPAKEVFPLAQQANIGIIARVPLRGGLLAGKFTAADQAKFQADDVRVRRFPGDAFAKELAKVEKLRFLVHSPITSFAQAANAFCLAHPAVSTVIPGARNPEQMRQNASASGARIPETDLKRIAELWASGFGVS